MVMGVFAVEMQRGGDGYWANTVLEFWVDDDETAIQCLYSFFNLWGEEL